MEYFQLKPVDLSEHTKVSCCTGEYRTWSHARPSTNNKTTMPVKTVKYPCIVKFGMCLNNLLMDRMTCTPMNNSRLPGLPHAAEVQNMPAHTSKTNSSQVDRIANRFNKEHCRALRFSGVHRRSTFSWHSPITSLWRVSAPFGLTRRQDSVLI